MPEIQEVNTTTYEVELPSGDRVEIGDKSAVNFKPHLRLNRWGGECFIKVGLPTVEKIAPVVEAGKIKWRGQRIETHFYSLEPRTVIAKDKRGRDVPFTQNELGGFEFKIILKEKPATDKIVFDIQAQGLRFSYQRPLTQQEIDTGDIIRPDNVVGSYAVYHATKKNNEYMTGKAFHIYRPIAEDALGNKAWCDIQFNKYIDPTRLTLAIPQQFLDEATYPVTIDPDFGYTSIGEGSINIAAPGAQTRVGSAWSMLAPGGTTNYIRAYVGGTTGITCDCKVFINQKDSGGEESHGQIATKENLDCAEAYHWEEFTLSGETLTRAVVYILNIMGNGADIPEDGNYYRVKLDLDATIAYYQESGNYGTPGNPWVAGPQGWAFDVSIYCNYTELPVTAPIVTTQAFSSIGATTAIGNGNITDDGNEGCDKRGIVYDLASHGDPGNTAPADSDYGDYEEETDCFGIGAFTRSLSGLSTGRTYYGRAYAHNSEGYSYGGEVSCLTKPAAPTNVAATDGVHIDKVVITWTKSTGATGYQVYRDGTPLGWLGDVATFDDTGAGAPSITPGAANASDGLYEAYVALSLSGESANNGATHTYRVRARNATGQSVYSGTNTGYRGVGSLTYQWQRSAADSDADYSNIDGATTEAYNDTGAPENGDGRYYRCVENATGASQQISAVDRGYRLFAVIPTVTTQAVSDIGTTTATGNGNITDIGGETCSKRGVCWNTTGNPTVADSKSEETDSFGTGAFTRPMTGLDAGQHYYVKAYAYNSAGYGYGSQVEFTTSLPRVPRHSFVNFQDPGIV